MHFTEALCTHLAVLRCILQKLLPSYMVKEILGGLRLCLCESPNSALKLRFSAPFHKKR